MALHTNDQRKQHWPQRCGHCLQKKFSFVVFFNRVALKFCWLVSLHPRRRRRLRRCCCCRRCRCRRCFRLYISIFYSSIINCILSSRRWLVYRNLLVLLLLGVAVAIAGGFYYYYFYFVRQFLFQFESFDLLVHCKQILENIWYSKREWKLKGEREGEGEKNIELKRTEEVRCPPIRYIINTTILFKIFSFVIGCVLIFKFNYCFYYCQQKQPFFFFFFCIKSNFFLMNKQIETNETPPIHPILFGKWGLVQYIFHSIFFFIQ